MLCGTNFAEALLKETEEVEANGGLMTIDGERRRTKGGVFFYLARFRMPGAMRRIVYNRKGRMPDADNEETQGQTSAGTTEGKPNMSDKPDQQQDAAEQAAQAQQQASAEQDVASHTTTQAEAQTEQVALQQQAAIQQQIDQEQATETEQARTADTTAKA